MRRFRLLLFPILLISIVPHAYSSPSRVYFNLSNLKVHKLTCHWGQKCTINCVIINRDEAYRRGGVSCKVCEG